MLCCTHLCLRSFCSKKPDPRHSNMLLIFKDLSPVPSHLLMSYSTCFLPTHPVLEVVTYQHTIPRSLSLPNKLQIGIFFCTTQAPQDGIASPVAPHSESIFWPHMVAKLPCTTFRCKWCHCPHFLEIWVLHKYCMSYEFYPKYFYFQAVNMP
jgi:hypothetical protein